MQCLISETNLRQQHSKFRLNILYCQVNVVVRKSPKGYLGEPLLSKHLSKNQWVRLIFPLNVNERLPTFTNFELDKILLRAFGYISRNDVLVQAEMNYMRSVLWQYQSSRKFVIALINLRSESGVPQN